MGENDATAAQDQRVLPKGTVLIAGGGPVGLILARVLSFYGVRSILFERNKTTTSWPKMDLTNGRSMELFRKMGLAEDLRRQGVPGNIDQDVLISSGLSTKEPLTKWKLPGVDKFRRRIEETNDGTQPLEPWQRLSQAIFEKWLKAICEKDPLIELRYGWKVENVEESSQRVTLTVVNCETNNSINYISDYAAGCDGASSMVRKSLGLPLDGGPIPTCALLIHFKSRDLDRLHTQGRFWHIFLLQQHGGFGAAIIAQDEVETWTVHLFLPLDAEIDKIESREAVYRALGGLYGDYPIAIDEILVRSTWRPNIAVAREWSSPNRRVFLAGDAAHQNIPTGGYGMNMGIADAFDLGWKLAAVIHGRGGDGLLRSYELERRPVALRNVDRSGVHFQVHSHLDVLLAGGDVKRVDADTEEGRALRATIHEHYQKHDGENQDLGIELGYRYQSPVIVPEKDEKEPPWAPSHYTPTSWPGGRAPHIFLSDGSAIFDQFGKDWTLLNFSDDDCGQKFIMSAAEDLSVPVRQVDLSNEELARKLYERNLVLIRPDQHVAWRANAISDLGLAKEIVGTVSGKLQASNWQNSRAREPEKVTQLFTGTKEMTTQVGTFEMERMGDFQA